MWVCSTRRMGSSARNVTGQRQTDTCILLSPHALALVVAGNRLRQNALERCLGIQALMRHESRDHCLRHLLPAAPGTRQMRRKIGIVSDG